MNRALAALPTSPPVREQGAPQGGLQKPTGPAGLFAALTVIDDREYQKDWIWPTSVRETVPRMLNDAHLDGLYRGATLPIRAYDWRLEPNGSDPAVFTQAQKDFGLDAVGAEPAPRAKSRNRFIFDAHLAEALRGIAYGHRFFEQVADVRQDGPASVNGGWLAHLRKLADRPPSTIEDIAVSPDGGLKSVRVPAQSSSQPFAVGLTDLAVNRLVAYVWEREGANWRGRSMLRSCHRPWKLKDRVMTVGAINIERAGGVPYIEGAPGMQGPQLADLNALAQRFRVGETAGAAIPHGATLKFASAAGGDQAVGYVRLQNEEMARAWLMMFMQLGQTETGSRALGESFIDYFSLAQQAIARWFRDTFNEHVIEDWLEWNYGDSQQFAPRLVFEQAGDPADALGSALEEAASQGALPEGSQALAAVGGQSHRRPFRHAPASAGLTITTPAGGERTLRRQRFPHEVAAATDFEAIEQAYLTALDGLLADVAEVRSGQIDELVAQVELARDDLERLAAITVTAAGAQRIAERLQAAAREAVGEARREAAAQGVTVPDPDLAVLDAALDAHGAALAETLARGVALSGSSAAVRLHGSEGELSVLVREHLEGMTWASAEQELRGAVQAASNGGRFEVLGAAEAEADTSRLYHSSLLDQATCGPCAEADGQEYADMADVDASFTQGGGYALCEGGPRCRCTAVLVVGESEASVE